MWVPRPGTEEEGAELSRSERRRHRETDLHKSAIDGDLCARNDTTVVR